MIVPNLTDAVIDMNITDTVLDQSPGQEAAIGKWSIAIFGADRFRLFSNVEDIQRLELHSVRRLHRFDPAFEVVIRSKTFGIVPVERLDRVQIAALGGGLVPFVLQIGDHLLRLDLSVVEADALMLRRQKTDAGNVAASAEPARAKHDKGWQ